MYLPLVFRLSNPAKGAVLRRIGTALVSGPSATATPDPTYMKVWSGRRLRQILHLRQTHEQPLKRCECWLELP